MWCCTFFGRSIPSFWCPTKKGCCCLVAHGCRLNCVGSLKVLNNVTLWAPNLSLYKMTLVCNLNFYMSHAKTHFVDCWQFHAVSGNAMTGSRVLQCEAGRKVLRRIFYFAHSFEPKTFKDHLTLFQQSKGIFTPLIVPAFSQWGARVKSRDVSLM